ncbi:MAG: hypothetical protein WC047_00110 [Kiritimatiellales bacterium]
MSDLNERVSILEDVRDGVSVALDEVNKAPSDVKELDILAYADVIAGLVAAKSTLERLCKMAQYDANQANRAEDERERRGFEREAL